MGSVVSTERTSSSIVTYPWVTCGADLPWVVPCHGGGSTSASRVARVPSARSEDDATTWGVGCEVALVACVIQEANDPVSCEPYHYVHEEVGGQTSFCDLDHLHGVGFLQIQHLILRRVGLVVLSPHRQEWEGLRGRRVSNHKNDWDSDAWHSNRVDLLT